MVERSVEGFQTPVNATIDDESLLVASLPQEGLTGNRPEPPSLGILKNPKSICSLKDLARTPLL